MENEPLIENLLHQVLTKIDVLTTQIGTIQIDHANLRGEFSTQLLQQARLADEKLLSLERQFNEKVAARAEKVDGWFDAMQGEFSNHQKVMEGRITGVSVKVGLVFSIVTIFLAGAVTAVIRYLTASN